MLSGSDRPRPDASADASAGDRAAATTAGDERARRDRTVRRGVAIAGVAAVIAGLVVVRVATSSDDGEAPIGGATGSTRAGVGPAAGAGVPASAAGGGSSVPPGSVPRAAVAPPATTVSVYGAAGTFRALTPDVRVTSTGHDIAAVAVPNWGFDPGASAFFATMTDGGRVVFGTVPQTDNQTAPTGATMSVGVFDPTGALGPSFRSLDVLTDRGARVVTAPGSTTGGADVSDVCTVPTPDGSRVFGFSALPYKGWDRAVMGTWPAVLALADDPSVDGASGVTIDASRTRTAEQLRDDPRGADAFDVVHDEHGEWADTRGLGECDATPRGDVVVSQYFFAPDGGSRSGSLTAFGPDGRVVAFLQLPNAVLTDPLELDRPDGRPLAVPAGTTLDLSPREVRADPSTTDPDDQRFVVIYDALVPDPEQPDPQAFGAQVPTPFALQEFRLDATRGTITPTSDPVVTRDRRRLTTDRKETEQDEIVRANTTVYAPDGTLFVSRSPASGASSLVASTVAVFRPHSLGGRPSEPAPWGRVVTPDAVLESTAGGDQPLTTIRAIEFDRATSSLVMVSGVDARLRAVRWNGWDGDRARAETPFCDVDLGGLLLANPTPGYRMQVRQSALDEPRQLLYVPYQGLQPASGGPPNESVPQYVFEIRLDRVLAPEAERSRGCRHG